MHGLRELQKNLEIFTCDKGGGEGEVFLKQDCSKWGKRRLSGEDASSVMKAKKNGKMKGKI